MERFSANFSRLVGRSWLLFYLLSVLSMGVGPIVTNAQVEVNGTTNNMPISELRLDYNGTKHTQTNILTSRFNPTPNNVPVIIETILLNNGIEIFATTRFPTVHNLHPAIGNNALANNAIGVAKFDGSYVSHKNAGFQAAIEEVVSTPDLRSYWDINGTAIPSGQAFMDVMYPVEVPKTGYLVVSERDGNSKMDFQALDIDGNPIVGAQTIKLRGYQWNTRIVNPTNQSTQPQHLVVFSPQLFNTNLPIYGFRIINIDGADGKIVFFRNSIHAVSDLGPPVEAGQQAVMNVLDNDELKEQPASTENVFINIIQPEPNNYIVLNPDGTVDVSPNAPVGEYTIYYEICEIGNSGNCSSGSVTLETYVILPVIWNKTSAIRLESGNLISWSTLKEKNNSKFILMKSVGNVKDFWEISEIKAEGNTNDIHFYNYMEKFFLEEEDVYYKIKQIDVNGISDFSPVFKLDKSGFSTPNIQLFPNPYITENPITLILPEGLKSKKGVFEVKNSMGQQLVHLEGNFQNMAPRIKMSLKKMSRGLHFISFMYDNEIRTIKWTVK